MYFREATRDRVGENASGHANSHLHKRGSINIYFVNKVLPRRNRRPGVEKSKRSTPFSTHFPTKYTIINNPLKKKNIFFAVMKRNEEVKFNIMFLIISSKGEWKILINKEKHWIVFDQLVLVMNIMIRKFVCFSIRMKNNKSRPFCKTTIIGVGVMQMETCSVMKNCPVNKAAIVNMLSIKAIKVPFKRGMKKNKIHKQKHLPKKRIKTK